MRGVLFKIFLKHSLIIQSLQGISTACAVTAMYVLARRVPLPARATIAANCMLAMVGVQVRIIEKGCLKWVHSNITYICWYQG